MVCHSVCVVCVCMRVRERDREDFYSQSTTARSYYEFEWNKMSWYHNIGEQDDDGMDSQRGGSLRGEKSWQQTEHANIFCLPQESPELTLCRW